MATEVLNASGIALDGAKIAAMPEGVFEVEGYKESFRADESYAVRVFDVAWQKRKVFADWALGYSLSEAYYDKLGGIEGYRIRRTIPSMHPEYTWLYAASIEHVQNTGAMGQYQIDAADDQGAQVTDYIFNTTDTIRYAVTYRDRDYEIRGDSDFDPQNASGLKLSEMYRYVTHNQVAALQSLPVPGWVLKFNDDPTFPANIRNQTINAAAGNRLFPTKEVTMVWHQVPDVPEENISKCEGRVNEDAFFPPFYAKPFVVLVSGVEVVDNAGTLWQGYPPGTLLMLAPKTERKRGLTGRVHWEITYKFLFRRQGHNRFPALDGNFYEARIGGSLNGRLQYETADFNLLFKVPAPRRYQGING